MELYSCNWYTSSQYFSFSSAWSFCFILSDLLFSSDSFILFYYLSFLVMLDGGARRCGDKDNCALEFREEERIN